MGPRTCTQHSPSNVSQSIHHAPSQAEAFTCMYRRCWFLRKQNDTLVSSLLLYAQTDRLPRSHPSSNQGSDTIVGSRGELGTVHIKVRTTAQARETPQVWVHLLFLYRHSCTRSHLLLVPPLMVSPQRTDTVPPLLLSAQTDRLPRSYPSSNGVLIPLLGHWGSLEDRPHRG